jgi:ketosteroid isomerase-like protein
MSLTESTASTTSTERGTVDPVRAFLDAIEAGAIADCRCWADDAVVDATVPNWRFTIRGADAIRDEYGRWFAGPSTFEELRRLSTTEGEVVEYLQTWTEGGVPHAAHHVHVLTVRDGAIVADTVMCGGRWPAALLAEMEAAKRG